MSFLNEIKNQFGKIIKILHDNTKECFSSYLSKLLSLHESTSFCTPPQNVVERKNRYLVEITRTLIGKVGQSTTQLCRLNNIFFLHLIYH